MIEAGSKKGVAGCGAGGYVCGNVAQQHVHAACKERRKGAGEPCDISAVLRVAVEVLASPGVAQARR